MFNGDGVSGWEDELLRSRWQCVNSDGSGSLDENFAGYRAGRVTAHQRAAVT